MAAEFVAKTPILADAVKDLTGFYQQLAAPTTPAVRACARGYILIYIDNFLITI
jgi:hypothetical protein